MNTKNKKVSEHIDDLKQWQPEVKALRKILLETPLTEELKWSQPCYTVEGKNIVLLGGFKSHCILSFFKGSLLKDPYKVLEKPGPNTQSAKLMSFTNTDEVESKKEIIYQYINEAIQIEKDGGKIQFKTVEQLDTPKELQESFNANKYFEEAFHSLSPGRQKGYILYFSGAKQSATRTSRIEKNIPRILDGFGLHDCVCSRSKKMPNCDGSHKDIKTHKNTF